MLSEIDRTERMLDALSRSWFGDNELPAAWANLFDC